MITLADPDAATRGDEFRACAAALLQMMEQTGETQTTVDGKDLYGLLLLAAWAADVQDEMKRQGAV